MKKLRLILGDQLNYNHSWFLDPNEDTIYFMAEMRQETDYAHHHIQKVVAFFKAMRNYANWLKKQGFDVIYYKLDDAKNQQELPKNLLKLIKNRDILKFEYQLPDEYRLDEQLKLFCQSLNIESEAFSTEHFLTSRTELSNFYKNKKTLTMEYFYRYMRKKYNILMIQGKYPEGGKWNFDKSNRKKWTGEPAIPEALIFDQDVTAIVTMISKSGVKTIGNIAQYKLDWPTDRWQSLDLLNYFCKHLLISFGDYQDAMHDDEYYLYHSRLSFALNSKMLHPEEVIHTAVDYWRAHKETISISEIEGFVRQILGWREYMRGIYWKQMPSYATVNSLENYNPLPDFYWTAKTKMNCLHHTIKQSLDHAYAHHIQRLMVTGNYALLTMTHPDEVDQWYLGIYIDAIEWVEMPNTRGMSQFADNGIVATKPYISSGNYINKMSNYCKSCHYKVSKKTENDACPFNSLYWNFLSEKRDYFRENPRMKMMLDLLDKIDSRQLEAIRTRSAYILKNPQNL